MPIVMAVVLSTFLLSVTGCATPIPPSAAKQETDRKGSTKKAFKHDQMKPMNEESMEAVR
jgi:hypothetical protein